VVINAGLVVTVCDERLAARVVDPAPGPGHVVGAGGHRGDRGARSVQGIVDRNR
jgi:hypothetical protein